MKKWVLISIICIIVGSIGLGVLYMFGKGDGLKHTDTKVIHDSEVKTIYVNADVGDITIQKSKDDAIHIEQIAGQKKYKLRTEENSGILNIESKSNSWFSISLPFLSDNSVKLTIQLPEKEYENIKTNTTLGNIDMKDVIVEKIVTETSTGDIKMKNIKGKEMQASSNLGNVLIQEFEGTIQADTSTGNVKLENVKENDIKGTSTLGNVDIILKEKPEDAVVKGKTTLGNIALFGKENKQIEYGNKTYTISGKTSTGNVTIKTEK